MKRLCVLCLALIMLCPLAVADDNELSVELDLFETLYNIYADYYQAPPLPEMQQRDAFYCYYAEDYSILVTLYESGRIESVYLYYNKPLDFDFIALSACVVSSVFGEQHNDSLMDVIFQYRNGVTDNVAIFNDRQSMLYLALRDNGNFVLVISAEIPGR